MTQFHIESIDDPRLELYRNLKQTNLTRWSGRFIAEGIRLVERLVQSRFEVESILVAEPHLRRLPDGISPTTSVYVAPLPLLELIVGYRFHAGMLACGVRGPQGPLVDWLPEADRPALIVACPRTADPDNLGTIIRVAAGFGAAGLLLGQACADPFSRRTLRLSMGNAFFLPIYQSDDFETDLQTTRRQGRFESVASALSDRALPLAQAQRPRRMVLLLGNESDGLPESIVSNADHVVQIPMAEKIDSLNVGIAAGIMLHHFTQVAGWVACPE